MSGELKKPQNMAEALARIDALASECVALSAANNDLVDRVGELEAECSGLRQSIADREHALASERTARENTAYALVTIDAGNGRRFKRGDALPADILADPSLRAGKQYVRGLPGLTTLAAAPIAPQYQGAAH